jgi:hypothetical protein
VAGDQASAVGDQLRAMIAAAKAEFVLEVTANLTAACPVKTGHARRNFVPTIGEPHSGEDDGTAQAAGIISVSAYKLGDGPLNITNNVPYIGRLIGGSSSQAPAGWDLQAIDEAANTVQARHDSLRVEVSGEGTGPAAIPIAVTITGMGRR